MAFIVHHNGTQIDEFDVKHREKEKSDKKDDAKNGEAGKMLALYMENLLQ
jgi:hypothetical protein